MLGSLADLAVTHADGVCVLRLTGEIDLSNADSLLRDVVTAAASSELVIVDTGGIQFIDSAGLRMLVSAANAIGDRSARLRLVVGAESPIARLVSITNFAALMPIDESVAEASRMLGQPPDSA